MNTVMLCFGGGGVYTLYRSAVQFLYSGKVCDNLALHSTETVDLSWEQLPYIFMLFSRQEQMY